MTDTNMQHIQVDIDLSVKPDISNELDLVKMGICSGCQRKFIESILCEDDKELMRQYLMTYEPIEK